MGAIEIGDLVWNGHSGWLRLGRVPAKRIADNGWADFTVDWLKDEKYQNAQDYYHSINPKGNYGLAEFKAGQLYTVELQYNKNQLKLTPAEDVAE